MRGDEHVRVAMAISVCLLLGGAGILATSAFTWGDLGTRSIQVDVVGDGAAYLSVDANPSSPHRCFVDTQGALVSVSFATLASPCNGSGNGLGINGGDGSDTDRWSRYAFHDLLRVTNRGVRDVSVWVNTTTTSAGGSVLDVAADKTLGVMTGTDYGAAIGPISLAVGEVVYLGVRVKSGTLQSGVEVTGTLTLEARA